MKKRKLFPLVFLVIVVALAAVFFWQETLKKTDDSLSQIKKRGVLIVGSDIPYGVMEFFDQNNKPVGIDVDIASEIASRLGLKLEFKDYDWDKLFPVVKNGEVDLAISSITITPDREREMLFSNPYFNGGQVIIVGRDNQEIKGINNLEGKRIAVQKETTSFAEAKRYTSENLISTYLNFENVDGAPYIISDLRDNKFDAIIVDYSEALSILKNNLDLKIVGTPFTKEDYGIASKLGNNSLMEKVNNVLADMDKDGTLKKIEIKWTTFN